MKSELVQLGSEVIDRQSRMRELENKIQLAELCLPPCRSEAQNGHSSLNIALLGELRGSQQVYSRASGFASSTSEMGSLTFSPSDQTLVEQGQGAMFEAPRLPFTTDEDIKMSDLLGAIDSVQSPARLENRCQRSLDPFEEFIAYDQVQPIAASAPLEGRNRKRRRISGIFEPELSLIESSGPVNKECASQNTTSTHVLDLFQRNWKSGMFRTRSRLSRILLGQLVTLQTRLDGTPPPRMGPQLQAQTELSEADTERPVSYPQSQRWRKSLGVSVKSLTEGFERMRVNQQEI